MAEHTRDDFDALLAKLKRLEPPDMTDCLGLVVGYNEVSAERDALAAELTAVKAGLPKWHCWVGHPCSWVLQAVWVGDVGYVGQAEGRWLGHAPTRFCQLRDTREAAMLAVTEALGLPPCEVEGE
jgi:hypothetical protein